MSFALTNTLSHLGSGWRPSKATSATLIGWYEVFDWTVTRVSGDTSQVNNLIAGGANPLVQATALNRPAYSATSWNSSYPGITFDGVQDILTANGLASSVTGTDQPFTVQLLGQMVTLGSVGNIRTIWGFGNTADDNPLHDLRLPASTTGIVSSGRRDSGAIAKIKDAATAITTSREMRSLVFNGTKVSLYTNGTLDSNLDGVSSTADNDVGALTLNTFSVGGFTRTTISGFSNFTMGAILVYAGTLSGAEIAKNERYLENGHPL